MATPPEAAPLPLRNKLLYASGSLGGNVISRSRDLWLIYFYAPPSDADLPTLIPRVTLGLLLFAARVIEALDERVHDGAANGSPEHRRPHPRSRVGPVTDQRTVQPLQE